MQPEISVIVPNYNHGQFLKRRIESILNQTFTDFELILLDDCSKDESKSIIESYRYHPKVSKIIYNDINGGSPFLQWKKGIDNANGKYIWIAESDDWCEETLLKALFEPFLKQEDLVLSHCQVVRYEDNIIKPLVRFNKLSEVRSGQVFIVNELLYHNSILNASAVVFKKEAFNKISHSYTTMKLCGDWCIWYNLLWQGSIHTSGKFLSYFNKHSQDVTSTSRKDGLLFLEGLKITKHIVDNFEVPSPLLKKAEKVWLKNYNNFKKENNNLKLNFLIESEITATFNSPALFENRKGGVYKLIKHFLKKVVSSVQKKEIK